MKHLYQPGVAAEINERVHMLTPQSQRQWGKMDVAQMMAHCTAAFEVATGQKSPPRLLIGKLLSWTAKGDFLGEKPFKPNYPTDKSFVMTGSQKDFQLEKKRLLDSMNVFVTNGPEKCTSHPHSFFGKLTPEEWSVSMYKHMDHHLRQFGV